MQPDDFGSQLVPPGTIFEQISELVEVEDTFRRARYQNLSDHDLMRMFSGLLKPETEREARHVKEELRERRWLYDPQCGDFLDEPLFVARYGQPFPYCGER